MDGKRYQFENHNDELHEEVIREKIRELELELKENMDSISKLNLISKIYDEYENLYYSDFSTQEDVDKMKEYKVEMQELTKNLSMKINKNKEEKRLEENQNSEKTLETTHDSNLNQNSNSITNNNDLNIKINIADNDKNKNIEESVDSKFLDGWSKKDREDWENMISYLKDATKDKENEKNKEKNKEKNNIIANKTYRFENNDIDEQQN